MLINYLDNLNIRSKLILFLIVPVLTILFFSISGIYTKFQEQQDARKSFEFISISFQIDDLIHELQKERGLSAGFVGSGGKLQRQELQEQRRLTNEKLALFFLELEAKNPQKSYWGLFDEFSRFQLRLQSLPAMRDATDGLKKSGVFEEYSWLISIGLNITQHLKVVVGDAIVARQSDAFTGLLLLQERSGQERGLLNAVFTSGQLDAERLKNISAYASDQDALFKNFYTVASSEHKTLLRERMERPEISEVGELRTAAIHKASRNDRLNSLLSLIGYGGLIHNFKNYVIRGQQSYANQFDTIYVDVVNIIKEYQDLPGVSENEIDSLNIIKATFLEYKSMLETIKGLMEEGKTINEIDSMVKVDDRPALREINYLHKNITGLDTSKWWDKASARIDLMREVSNSIRLDINDLAEQNLAFATRSFYIYIALTIASLMVSFALGYRLIHRLVGGILNIEMHMEKMQDRGEFNKLLIVSGTDEISKVEEAFNNLISERSKSEEEQENLRHQLLQAQKMEALGQLTGGIAHDFNNMLSAIMGYTSLAAMELDKDKDKDKLHRYLSEVAEAGNRAKDLIIQMLAFSRSDDIEQQLLDSDSLLKESIKMIRPLLPGTIEFEAHISNNVTSIMANPAMIHQVIMNLCINARDAIVERGRIELESRLVSINNVLCSSCHMPVTGDFIEVSIQDTGSGIEPKNINNLFEPFFSTKEMGKEKGTGMGLAIVHGIMHKHNGHIIVESTLGKGSKFRLLFPLALIGDTDLKEESKEIDHVELPAIEPTAKPGGYNLLLIDDDKSMVTLMKEVLETQGYRVTAFTDSELALAHFKENNDQYDLVITDQTMPALTGLELAKGMLNVRPDIPVVLCSGYSEHIDAEDAKRIGIKACMSKPVKMKDLLNKINQLL